MKVRTGSLLLALALSGSLALPAAAAAPQVTIGKQYLFAGATDQYYTEEAYRASPVVVDLDGDGKLEVLNAAYSLTVMDAATGTEKWRVNAGRDRSSAYDIWNNVPGGQVFTDFEVSDVDADGRQEIIIAYGDGSVSVLNEQGYFEPGWPQRPTTAGIRSLALEDLDGDGRQEILFNTYAGKLHCFSLDGTEHGSWPFTLPKSNGSVYEYASAPACVDLNGDGKKEVIFASWTDNDASSNTGVDGALYVMSHDGQLLARQDLHPGYATYEGVVNNQNGVMSAPVVKDVDADGKYEVFLNTTYYALCVYELTASGAPASQDPQPSPLAHPSTQTVTIDGKPVELQAYALKDANGYDTNYVKLRDVAHLLNGTAAQFSVGWDGAVNVTTGQAYAPNGSEMQTPFSGVRAYTPASAPTRVNGADAALEAIVLNDDAGGGYTYYKLRDLGSALGFLVDWSPETGIFIQTK